jgi:hypothetical protein
MRKVLKGSVMLPGLAVLVLGLVAMVGMWRAPASEQSVRLQLAANTTTDTSGAFTINATTVTGLYPGATKTLVLSITNPYSFDLNVTALSASLASTSSALCTASSTNLAVRAYQGPPALPIRVKSSRTLTVGSIPLFMPNTVATACQGVTFTISLKGTASKVAT